MPADSFIFRPPPWPQQQRRYVPIPAQGDQPPRSSIVGMMEAVMSWPTGREYQPYQRRVTAPIPAQGDQPPRYSPATIYSIIGSWALAPTPFEPTPYVAPLIPTRVDNPPPTYSLGTFFSIIGEWQPPAPQPTQRPTTFPFPSASPPPPPPFVPFKRMPESILDSWVPPPYQPYQPVTPVTPSRPPGFDAIFVNRIQGKDVDSRIRRHSEVVASILNSLIRQGIIKPTNLGNPGQDWTIDLSKIT